MKSAVHCAALAAITLKRASPLNAPS